MSLGTDQIYAALRTRFCAPEWAIFFEVANGTGHHGRNYADAVAMNLYPSRGLAIHGFEVKASRSDWHRELRNPAKAEAIYKYCDYWWLVVGDRDLVKDGELPATWGLMAPKGKGLQVVTQGPKLTPAAIDRTFFAALARRSAEVPAAQVEAMVRTRVEQEIARNKPYETQKLDRLQKTHQDVMAQVRAFESASGVAITSRWDSKPEQVGAAIRFLLEGGLKSIDSTLEIMERHASGVMDTIKAVRATPELSVQTVPTTNEEATQ